MENHLVGLPTELIIEISSRLNHVSRCQLVYTCKHFRNILSISTKSKIERYKSLKYLFRDYSEDLAFQMVRDWIKRLSKGKYIYKSDKTISIFNIIIHCIVYLPSHHIRDLLALITEDKYLREKTGFNIQHRDNTRSIFFKLMYYKGWGNKHKQRLFVDFIRSVIKNANAYDKIFINIINNQFPRIVNLFAIKYRRLDLIKDTCGIYGSIKIHWLSRLSVSELESIIYYFGHKINIWLIDILKPALINENIDLIKHLLLKLSGTESYIHILRIFLDSEAFEYLSLYKDIIHKNGINVFVHAWKNIHIAALIQAGFKWIDLSTNVKDFNITLMIKPEAGNIEWSNYFSNLSLVNFSSELYKNSYKLLSTGTKGNGKPLPLEFLAILKFDWQLETLLDRGYTLIKNDILSAIKNGVTLEYCIWKRLFIFLCSQGVELEADDLSACLQKSDTQRLELFLLLNYNSLKNNVKYIESTTNDYMRSVLIKSGFATPPEEELKPAKIPILSYSILTLDCDLIKMELDIARRNPRTIYSISRDSVVWIISRLDLEHVELILKQKNIYWYNSSTINLSTQYFKTHPTISQLFQKYNM